jgi:tetratricopeptide (TPR) repeat protein
MEEVNHLLQNRLHSEEYQTAQEALIHWKRADACLAEGLLDDAVL